LKVLEAFTQEQSMMTMPPRSAMDRSEFETVSSANGFSTIDSREILFKDIDRARWNFLIFAEVHFAGSSSRSSTVKIAGTFSGVLTEDPSNLKEL
jgi:hypothetical protein